MRILLKIGYHLLQWTWGLAQNIVGAAFFLAVKTKRTERFHGALCVTYSAPEKSVLGCFSLGEFVFMRDNVDERFFEKVKVHEYGHTIQSLIFGPLYLPFVALPSMLRASSYNRCPAIKRSGLKPYTSAFPEKGASRLGELITKMRAMDW